MLNDYPLTPRLPAADIDRARSRAAWLKDSEGNILELSEVPE